MKATGETVVYSSIEWPSKESRNEGWKKAMTDPRMQSGENAMPFDGQRLIYGVFVPIPDA